jgi:hypothetical protein
MSGLVDIDALEALLVEAAYERRSMTYAEVLAHFGIRITPRRVYALCRDLGAVCERNRARGEPELAVLVVRKADRLPGEGFFHGYWRDGAYDGPSTGAAATAFIRAETKRVFDFFATARARSGYGAARHAVPCARHPSGASVVAWSAAAQTPRW